MRNKGVVDEVDDDDGGFPSTTSISSAPPLMNPSLPFLLSGVIISIYHLQILSPYDFMMHMYTPSSTLITCVLIYISP